MKKAWPGLLSLNAVESALEKVYIDIPLVRPGTPGAYLLAALTVASATALRFAIDSFISGIPYITFYPAIIVTSLVSGFRAGLLSVALSCLAVTYLILPPRGSWTIKGHEHAVGLALFAATAALIVCLISAMRSAMKRYHDLSLYLDERVKERTEQLLKTEHMLAHAQKMEALGQLTSGIAHDFNNMTMIIRGNLHLMRMRLQKGDTDIEKFLDNALNGVERSAKLTERLLSFARRQPLSPSVVDINQLVLGLAELLKGTLGGNIALDFVLAQNLWNARADAGQLENAIINLAANARDAMPEGGKLTIETANAAFEDASASGGVLAGDYVKITVRDTGTGMSPEVVSRATEPFFTTKKAGVGTGLGLSQVYGFVKQSGGQFTLDSEVGCGTSISLYLPREGAARQPLLRPEQRLQQSRSMITEA